MRVALIADTVSITVMEIVDNAVLLAVPGAMDAGLADWFFWGSLAFALAVAFVVTLPVNRAMIARGKGHATVHAVPPRADHLRAMGASGVLALVSTIGECRVPSSPWTPPQLVASATTSRSSASTRACRCVG